MVIQRMRFSWSFHAPYRHCRDFHVAHSNAAMMLEGMATASYIEMEIYNWFSLNNERQFSLIAIALHCQPSLHVCRFHMEMHLIVALCILHCLA